MSGGHFDYRQHQCGQLADEIEILVEENEYPEEVIERFKTAMAVLRKAETMTQRIDWLVSGDDGIESFIRRWEEQIS